MTYCDSSFVVALFVPGDRFAPIASGIASKLSQGIPIIPVGEVELINRIHRGLGNNTMDANQHAAVLRQFEEDIADGILIRKTPKPQEHLHEALRLSRKHAPHLNIRSLDILHVAAARVLNITAFASFDKNQREMASAAGLRIAPIKIS